MENPTASMCTLFLVEKHTIDKIAIIFEMVKTQQKHNTSYQAYKITRTEKNDWFLA